MTEVVVLSSDDEESPAGLLSRLASRSSGPPSLATLSTLAPAAAPENAHPAVRAGAKVKRTPAPNAAPEDAQPTAKGKRKAVSAPKKAAGAASGRKRTARRVSSDDDSSDDEEECVEEVPKRSRALRGIGAQSARAQSSATKAAADTHGAAAESPKETKTSPDVLAAAAGAAGAAAPNDEPYEPPPPLSDAAAKSLERAYLRAREADVRARTFDLRQVVPTTVQTGRTIKPMSAWCGLWPALREFMQNSVDHLELFKGGGLNPAVLLRGPTARAGGGTELAFCCAAGGGDVLTIVCEDDELTITQRHTYPIHPRALDTGVADSTKSGGKTAGGSGRRLHS